MEVVQIIAELDGQIAKLQQARELLAATELPAVVKAGRGRPKGSKNSTSKTVKPAIPSKRTLTPEGRKRISDAMKKRWAGRRKKLSRKSPAGA